MGLWARTPREDEEPGGSGLRFDLEQRACPVCRRDLLPWQEHCPDDGTAAVRRAELPPALGPPPAHLLEEPD